MTLVRAVVEFKSLSGLPEDSMVNVLHFNTTVPVLPADLATIGAALANFYNGGATPAEGLDFWQSADVIDTTPLPAVTYYSVDPSTGLSGSPIGTSDLLGYDPPNGGGLPAEVGLTLSFHASLTGVAEEVPAGPPGPLGDMRPRARRRGRIFLPGLKTAAAEVVGGHVRPVAGLVLAGQLAGARLRDNSSLTAAAIDWVVYSKKDGVARDVVAGWVDNAFDTIRSRGPKATTRNAW